MTERTNVLPQLHSMLLTCFTAMDDPVLYESNQAVDFVNSLIKQIMPLIGQEFYIQSIQAQAVNDPASEKPMISSSSRAGTLTGNRYQVALLIDGNSVGSVETTFDFKPETSIEERQNSCALLDLLAGLFSSALARYYAEQRVSVIRNNQLSFISTVSHDMRSPLTVIKGYATMLGEVGSVNQTQSLYIDKIVGTVQSMAGLVNNILDAGRIDPEGNFAITRGPSDVSTLLDGLINEYTGIARNADLDLTAEIEEMAILNLDEELLKSAISNLLDNAVKYTPVGGAIHVQALTRGGRMEISVSDTGHGISEADQKMLFERFRRIPRREHVRIRGTGLGLYIVRGVARRHNGDVMLTSTPGKGSTFTITIPLEGANLLGGTLTQAASNSASQSIDPSPDGTADKSTDKLQDQSQDKPQSKPPADHADQEAHQPPD